MASTAWKAKQAEAKALIEQVKAANAEGIDSGEKAIEARRKVDDSLRLMAEVKAERLEDEKAELQALVKKFEEQDGLAAPEPAEPTVPATGLISRKASLTAQQEYDHPTASGQIKTVYSRKMMAALQLKALNESSGATGNFLVPPAYLQELFAATRRQGNALRRYGWLKEITVETNQVLLPRGAGAATVGIVAENVTKPSADQTYSQLTVNIFTWAGISKVSLQLMQDSAPTAAELVNQELGSLLGNLEEQKILNGSGTGEPRGILNISGTSPIPAATQTALNGTLTGQILIDAILDGVVAVQTNYFAPPTGILMHPKRLAFLQKSKDSQNNYVFNPPGTFRAPTSMNSGVTSVTTGGEASFAGLFGLPIAVSTNIPTTLGGGANADAVIVADWNQAFWLQRQDITMDTSDTAGTAFETNQVWFRLEERAGFTGERYPTAFCILTGTGVV